MEYRPLVRVRNLRFRYRGADADVLAISSLDIDGTGLTALVGPSGAGKSTLVELLAGTLREPYEGSVETLGVDIATLRSDADRQRHLRRVGFIPQDYGLLPGRTVRQILEQDLSDAQVPRGEYPRRIEAVTDAVGLAGLLDRQSNLLSGGQRQRTAIARMLARDVELVIADEPTANLDHERASEVLELFRQLAVIRPVIIVTHDAWLAAQCQRTVLLQTASTNTQSYSPHHSGWAWWSRAALLVVGLGLIGVGVSAGIHLVGGKRPPLIAHAPHHTPAVSVPPLPTTAGAALTVLTFSGGLNGPFKIIEGPDCGEGHDWIGMQGTIRGVAYGLLITPNPINMSINTETQPTNFMDVFENPNGDPPKGITDYRPYPGGGATIDTTLLSTSRVSRT
jgi:putative ABC transport system ATP-binding protein